MSTSPEELRLCPTRTDGADPLIAHAIHKQACNQRQRETYHKCFVCVHHEARHRFTDTAPMAALAPVPPAPPAPL